MGACLSIVGSTRNAELLSGVNGNEEDFRSRFLEDHVLGEGEFGQVKMVHDMKSQPNEPLACKYLKKGIVFKDNTIYSPIKPSVLRAEVKILQLLQQQAQEDVEANYCLQLHSLYETPRNIYIVTELCTGGDMNTWVSSLGETNTELRTEDVSRISYQLLSAIDHCNKYSIIHRDIKPENIMFKDSMISSQLRLIDFGSGTCLHTHHDPNNPSNTQGNTNGRNDADKNASDKGDDCDINHHTTFAGSAFYISPEMFQRTYTEKTDVWSVGVTLYVLVAGYPAECLQKAFNILQTASTKNRNLKSLPNLPSNLPETYYEMLEGLLVYRHKKRKSAADLLANYEFVTFHKQFHDDIHADNDELDVGISLDEIINVAAAGRTPTSTKPTVKSISKSNVTKFGKTASVRLEGSVQRHTIFLDYKKFERSLTTLLATILSRDELQHLIEILRKRYIPKQNTNDKKDRNETDNANGSSTDSVKDDGDENEKNDDVTPILIENQQGQQEKLKVISIQKLKDVLRDEVKNEQILPLIKDLKNSDLYDSYAYHVAMLNEFSTNKNHVNTNDNSFRSLNSRGRKNGIRDLTNPRNGSKRQARKLRREDSANSACSNSSANSTLSRLSLGSMRLRSKMGFLKSSNTNDKKSKFLPSNTILIPPATIATTTAAAATPFKNEDENDNNKTEERSKPLRKCYSTAAITTQS